MGDPVPGKGHRPALEITAVLAGRRIGLCGYDAAEVQRIGGILSPLSASAVTFDELLLSRSAQFCDVVILKLTSFCPDAVRVAAASSRATILVTGPPQLLLDGAGGAYAWAHDIITEPWTGAELMLRLFRALAASGKRRVAPPSGFHSEPIVLLADDDPDMVALVKSTLGNSGISCQVAEDGVSALRLAREIGPDLAVLDVKMPLMDGFEVLDTLRRDAALRSVPVILLTGCSGAEDVQRGFELRADDYLAKPVNPVRLLGRVKRLLASRTPWQFSQAQAKAWSAGRARPEPDAQP